MGHLGSVSGIELPFPTPVTGSAFVCFLLPFAEADSVGLPLFHVTHPEFGTGTGHGAASSSRNLWAGTCAVTTLPREGGGGRWNPPGFWGADGADGASPGHLRIACDYDSAFNQSRDLRGAICNGRQVIYKAGPGAPCRGFQHAVHEHTGGLGPCAFSQGRGPRGQLERGLGGWNVGFASEQLLPRLARRPGLL